MMKMWFIIKAFSRPNRSLKTCNFGCIAWWSKNIRPAKSTVRLSFIAAAPSVNDGRRHCPLDVFCACARYWKKEQLTLHPKWDVSDLPVFSPLYGENFEIPINPLRWSRWRWGAHLGTHYMTWSFSGNEHILPLIWYVDTLLYSSLKVHHKLATTKVGSSHCDA